MIRAGFQRESVAGHAGIIAGVFEIRSTLRRVFDSEQAVKVKARSAKTLPNDVNTIAWTKLRITIKRICTDC